MAKKPNLRTNLYFNSKVMGTPEGEYVLWCDGMGSGRALASSLDRAANFIFKLHQAFGLATEGPGMDDVEVYPIMDGLYVTTSDRRKMEKIIKTAFLELAYEFIKSKNEHRFMIRGGLAYGATLHGSKINEEAFEVNGQNKLEIKKFKESHGKILLSPALKLAYDAERLAPPFGIYVDNSVLSKRWSRGRRRRTRCR